MKEKDSAAAISHFDIRTRKLSNQRPKILNIAKRVGTPLYLYDAEEVRKNYRDFVAAFQSHGLEVSPCYAIKSNSYQNLLCTVVEEGGGLDASSQRELALALKAKAKHIVYTGPGKCAEDFEKILPHVRKALIHLESFQELKILGAITDREKIKVRCGVRVTTSAHSTWIKFGIPLSELSAFWKMAKKFPYISLEGIHFHISYVRNSKPYTTALREVGTYFAKNFSPEERKKITFIDMGGGYFPEAFEGIYPWNKDEVLFLLSQDKIMRKILADKYKPRVLPLNSQNINSLAGDISRSFKKHISKTCPNAKLIAEPGRFICHSAMHFLTKVLDVKNSYSAIVDAGNNLVGWERYQYVNYVPVFNLSRFQAKHERPFVTYGPLCTPDDVWGYYIYSKEVKTGDVLIIPYQGAYTYTLAQNFIRPIAPVYDL